MWGFLSQSALGLSVVVLTVSLVAAFLAVIAYTSYDANATRREARNARQEVVAAQKKRTDEQAKAAQASTTTTEPAGDPMVILPRKVGGSVYSVRSLDENGEPTTGAAFVVAADAGQSLLVTSFAPVRAATREPAPPVMVSQGSYEVKAELRTWQEERDLALLVIPRGGQPRLPWLPDDQALKKGDPIFAVGSGASGRSVVVAGTVVDTTSAGIQHNLRLNGDLQGAPLVDGRGRLAGVASLTYGGPGVQVANSSLGVPIESVCEVIVKCPSNPADASVQR